MVKEAVSSVADLNPTIDRIRKYSDSLALRLLSIFDALTEFDEDEAHPEAKEIAIEYFQQKFAERILSYTFAALLLLVAVTTVDFVLCGQLSNQMYGLSLDILGALILGRGLVMGGVAIGAVSSSKLGYNPLLVKTTAKDSVDGIWGIFLIITGLILQIIAFGGFSIPIPPWVLIC